jgi:hypothetical protein
VSIPPAWHPDPTGKHDHRWWDGTQWTEHVADAGVAAIDPLDAGGAPAGGGQAGTGAPAAGGQQAMGGQQATGGDVAGGQPGTGGADVAGGQPGTGGQQAAPGQAWSAGTPAAGGPPAASQDWSGGAGAGPGDAAAGPQPGAQGAGDATRPDEASPTGSDDELTTEMDAAGAGSAAGDAASPAAGGGGDWRRQGSVDEWRQAGEPTGAETSTGAGTPPGSAGWQQPEGPAEGQDAQPGGQADWGAAPGAAAGAWSGSTQPTGGPAGSGWEQPAQPGGADQPAQPAWDQPGQPGAWDQTAQPGGWNQQQPQPATASTDGMAVAAGVVGIVSLALSVLIFGALGGIVAIVLGGVALSRVKKSGRKGRGWAITGLVTGILSVVLAILLVVVGYAMFQGMGGFGPFEEFQECMERTGDQERCERELEEEMQRRFFGGD